MAVEILDTLTAADEKAEAAAITTLRSLARAVARGKTKPADATRLKEALDAGGVTRDEFGEWVEVVRECDALEAKATTRLAAEKLKAARDLRFKHTMESDRLAKKRQQDDARLLRQEYDAASELEMAERAEQAMHGFQLEHAELLNVEAPDLDLCTLVCNGSVGIGADDAPTLAVPPEVFQAQQTRRAELIEQADKRRRAHYENELDAWRATRRKTAEGRWVSKRPAPKYTPTTWADAKQLEKDGLI